MKHDDTSVGFDTNHDTGAAVVVETDEIAPEAEECLVYDDRAGLTPAEHIERKLVMLLGSSRVSQLHGDRKKRSLS